jgi:hypothetical protein
MGADADNTICMVEKGSIRDGHVPLMHGSLTMGGTSQEGNAKVNQDSYILAKHCSDVPIFAVLDGT